MCVRHGRSLVKVHQRCECTGRDDDSGGEAVLVSTQLHGKFVRFVRLFRRRDRHRLIVMLFLEYLDCWLREFLSTKMICFHPRTRKFLASRRANGRLCRRNKKIQCGEGRRKKTACFWSKVRSQRVCLAGLD